MSAMSPKLDFPHKLDGKTGKLERILELFRELSMAQNACVFSSYF